MKPATLMQTVLFSLLSLSINFVARAGGDDPTAREGTGRAILWENRGQTEFGGDPVDLDEADDVVVAVGEVSDASFDSRWFVRAMDRRTGTTKWEDRFGPATFDLAKDVAIDGKRAFVAGWILAPADGYVFVVRAYDLNNGALLWTQEIRRGSLCVEEEPSFARCVAKSVSVHDGRVFVVGHVTGIAAHSDFAVFAFNASSGAPLWESVTDPTSSGAWDFAWAVKAMGDSVFVLGEIGDPTGSDSHPVGLLLRSYDAHMGFIRWQRELPGTLNGTLKNTLAVDKGAAFIAGEDENGYFMVRAFDARSGELLWADRVDDGDRSGEAEALTFGGKASNRLLVATGVVGCNRATGVECRLGVRAYDPRRGLVWHRSDEARAGDWAFPLQVTADADEVFFGGGELLEDGQYHGTIRAYSLKDGTLMGEEAFDAGSEPAGFLEAMSVRGDGLLVGGEIFRGPDLSSDFVVRMYGTHELGLQHQR